ncbi:DUF2917 domain-containing protein [Xenophilus sp.]|uniref:DUF2917 domain-containing protein n=1 Tax=Xenophilus sp. TaxID=1873499 RepID=UPI0037DDABA3
MATDPNRFQLGLPARAIFTLPDGAGVGITCRSGSVWVTMDRDPRDIVLAPGERFEGREHRRMLVSALEASCISVSGTRPAALPLAAPAAVPRQFGQPGLCPA